MVRLKENVRNKASRNGLFQFHYGTIKSRVIPKYSKQILSFQFHYGTIKSLHYVKMKCYSGISIPLWYD